MNYKLKPLLKSLLKPLFESKGLHFWSRLTFISGLLLSTLLPQTLQAEEVVVEQESTRYVELKPTFVTNFGVSDTGHLRYVKADVTVRVMTNDGEYAARYHLPALRNRIVMLLSRQDESTISSAAGRETIKAEAIQELREVLEHEEGDGFIEDLLFTNFIVQR